MIQLTRDFLAWCAQMFAILNVFTTEKLIVQREFAARAYTAFPYYSSKLIAEQPFRLIGPLIFCCISYLIIGLNPKFERFLIFVLIVLLLAIAAQTLGIFLGCISKNEEIASNVSPLATVSSVSPNTNSLFLYTDPFLV